MFQYSGDRRIGPVLLLVTVATTVALGQGCGRSWSLGTDDCGDGICWVNEDCATCPTDCGACESGDGVWEVFGELLEGFTDLFEGHFVYLSKKSLGFFMP